MPEDFGMKGHSTVYNPAADRNLRHYIGGPEVCTKPIKAGDEILDNYLYFIGDRRYWSDDVMNLRNQCDEEDVGEVVLYEERFQRKEIPINDVKEEHP
jgi:hypothetical protein